MIDKLLAGVSAFIIATISSLGYGGVVLMMAIESACIPLPSEVIMPFSGYLVPPGASVCNRSRSREHSDACSARTSRTSSAPAAGDGFCSAYGRCVLIAPHEIEMADRFFARWGSPAVFLSRMLPVVRTFIAFPAGVARMRLLPFTIYTLAGSYLWCLTWRTRG